MHDPMVVALTIRRPWPAHPFRRVREGQPRWKVTIHGGRWWRPGNWSPFVTVAGREWWFPSLVTIWHVEPGGRDSGEVCKHWKDGKAVRAWRWHVHHWRIQVSPLQSIRARLFDRCTECGRKGRPNISHQWDGPGVGWRKWQSRSGLYHSECSSLVTLRRDAEADRELIRHLVAAMRVQADVSEAEMVDQITGNTSPLPFHTRYRLQRTLGFERDDNYRLVRSKR